MYALRIFGQTQHDPSRSITLGNRMIVLRARKILTQHVFYGVEMRSVCDMGLLLPGEGHGRLESFVLRSCHRLLAVETVVWLHARRSAVLILTLTFSNSLTFHTPQTLAKLLFRFLFMSALLRFPWQFTRKLPLEQYSALQIFYLDFYGFRFVVFLFFLRFVDHFIAKLFRHIFYGFVARCVILLYLEVEFM